MTDPAGVTHGPALYRMNQGCGRTFFAAILTFDCIRIVAEVLQQRPFNRL